jgi:hypothetical protein
VRLSDAETAELNEASSRGLERSGELREQLIERFLPTVVSLAKLAFQIRPVAFV